MAHPYLTILPPIFEAKSLLIGVSTTINPLDLTHATASGLTELQSDTTSLPNFGNSLIKVLKEAPVIADPVRLRISIFLMVDDTIFKSY